MIENLMEELRVMSEEHDNELCSEALSYIYELKYQIRTMKSDIGNITNNTRRLVGALREITQLTPERGDEAIYIAQFTLGDRQ
jgi:hypothetical protein